MYDKAYYNMGYALEKLQRYDEALKSLRTAFAINPKDEQTLLLIHHIFKTNYLSKSNLFDAAENREIKKVYSEDQDQEMIK